MRFAGVKNVYKASFASDYTHVLTQNVYKMARHETRQKMPGVRILRRSRRRERNTAIVRPSRRGREQQRTPTQPAAAVLLLGSLGVMFVGLLVLETERFSPRVREPSEKVCFQPSPLIQNTDFHHF